MLGAPLVSLLHPVTPFATNTFAQSGPERGVMHADVDFCVTLGGDGTVLHLTSLFTEDVPLPPLVSFAMGTLGFLTPFDVAQYQSCLTQVLTAPLTL